MKEGKKRANRINIIVVLASALLMIVAISVSVFADSNGQTPGKAIKASRHVVVESTYSEVGSQERTVGTDGGTVVVSSANGTTFTETKAGKFEADVVVGDMITVTGTPANGYVFNGVHKNSMETISMDNPFTFEVTEGTQYLEYDMNFKEDFVVLTIKWSSMDGATPLNDLVYEIPKGDSLGANQSTDVNNYFVKEGYSAFNILNLWPKPITEYDSNTSAMEDSLFIRTNLDSDTTLYYLMLAAAKKGSFTVEKPICGMEIETTTTGSGTEQTNPPLVTAKEGSQIVVYGDMKYWKTDNDYFNGTIKGGDSYKVSAELDTAFGYTSASGVTPSITVENADEGSVAFDNDNYQLSFTVTAEHDWDAGTVTKEATVAAEGEKTYKCTACGVTKTEAIPKKSPTSIAKATVSGIKEVTWTGKAIEQSPVVKLSGKTLKKATDYTVAYKNNKNVGKATVTITGTGEYTGTITKTFKIDPKGTSLAKVTKAKKAAKVKWNKQAKKMSKSRITGYQIQLATNSKFTKNKKTVIVKGYGKTSKKVTGLKAKKKYYVRIRTFKTVSGSKYYSPWSKVKTVKTK